MNDIRVSIFKRGPRSQEIRVGEVWKDGDTWQLHLPGGTVPLDESTLGPQWKVVENDDEDDDKTEIEMPSWAIATEVRAKRWSIYEDPFAIVTREPYFESWFCRWSVQGGVLIIHGINKTALPSTPLPDAYNIDGGLAPLYTPSRSFGLASRGYPPPVPTLEFVYFQGGVLSVLQTAVTATTSGVDLPTPTPTSAVMGSFAAVPTPIHIPDESA